MLELLSKAHDKRSQHKRKFTTSENDNTKKKKNTYLQLMWWNFDWEYKITKKLQ